MVVFCPIGPERLSNLFISFVVGCVSIGVLVLPPTERSYVEGGRG
jgi:hypothetical protein